MRTDVQTLETIRLPRQDRTVERQRPCSCLVSDRHFVARKEGRADDSALFSLNRDVLRLEWSGLDAVRRQGDPGRITIMVRLLTTFSFLSLVVSCGTLHARVAAAPSTCRASMSSCFFVIEPSSAVCFLACRRELHGMSRSYPEQPPSSAARSVPISLAA
jgi:hypothetical protein